MSKVQRKQLAATVSSDRPHNRLDEVKDWLTRNYIVRVNLLDRTKVSLNPTPECEYEYLHPITEDDIFLHAYADELPVSQKVLKLLLSSPNQMESFNPIIDYLNSLHGKYQGPSQIDLLSKSLHVVVGSPERAGRILRKWLIASAACALGIRQNDVALGLVGATPSAEHAT